MHKASKDAPQISIVVGKDDDIEHIVYTHSGDTVPFCVMSAAEYAAEAHRLPEHVFLAPGLGGADPAADDGELLDPATQAALVGIAPMCKAVCVLDCAATACPFTSNVSPAVYVFGSDSMPPPGDCPLRGDAGHAAPRTTLLTRVKHADQDGLCLTAKYFSEMSQDARMRLRYELERTDGGATGVMDDPMVCEAFFAHASLDVAAKDPLLLPWVEPSWADMHPRLRAAAGDFAHIVVDEADPGAIYVAVGVAADDAVHEQLRALFSLNPRNSTWSALARAPEVKRALRLVRGAADRATALIMDAFGVKAATDARGRCLPPVATVSNVLAPVTLRVDGGTAVDCTALFAGCTNTTAARGGVVVAHHSSDGQFQLQWAHGAPVAGVPGGGGFSAHPTLHGFPVATSHLDPRAFGTRAEWPVVELRSFVDLLR